MKSKPSSKPSEATKVRIVPKDPRQKTVKIDDLMLLMSHETERAVLFEIEAEPDSKVYIAGTFNEWNPTSHPLTYHPEAGVFRATLLLESGTHEYKFVVDGVWLPDAKCPHWVPNAQGTLNSVVHVQCSPPC